MKTQVVIIQCWPLSVAINQEKLLIRPANHVEKIFFTIERKAGWRILNDMGNITSFAQGEGPMVAILREKNVAYARLRIMPEKFNSSQKEIAICIIKRKKGSECRQ